VTRNAEGGRRDRTLHEELRFGYLIHDVSRLRRTLFDRWLSPLGITRSQWWVLAFLSRRDGMPQSELAGELDVGKVALGALVDRLESAGFVCRETSTLDRRVKHIHLTPKAPEWLDELRERSRAFNRLVLDGIPDEGITTAIRTLGTIKDNLLLESPHDVTFPTDAGALDDLPGRGVAG
jgi:DNA-binding MarR family transcriptional regulator